MPKEENKCKKTRKKGHDDVKHFLNITVIVSIGLQEAKRKKMWWCSHARTRYFSTTNMHL